MDRPPPPPPQWCPSRDSSQVHLHPLLLQSCLYFLPLHRSRVFLSTLGCVFKMKATFGENFQVDHQTSSQNGNIDTTMFKWKKFWFQHAPPSLKFVSYCPFKLFFLFFSPIPSYCYVAAIGAKFGAKIHSSDGVPKTDDQKGDIRIVQISIHPHTFIVHTLLRHRNCILHLTQAF